MSTGMNAKVRAVVVVLLLACCLKSTAFAGENWAQFRGAGARGVAEGSNLPTTWGAEKNVLWKQDVPGRGWSSPVVWGKRVFLTSVVNEAESEKPKKGLYFGGNRPKIPTTVHHWKVYCLDLNTGQILWEKQVHKGAPQNPLHVKNSYATETPVTDGKHVYAEAVRPFWSALLLRYDPLELLLTCPPPGPVDL